MGRGSFGRCTRTEQTDSLSPFDLARADFLKAVILDHSDTCEHLKRMPTVKTAILHVSDVPLMISGLLALSLPRSPSRLRDLRIVSDQRVQ